ncbi:MAG: hypothetical protein O7A98_09365, partial [Acidobacteria bacterium]|nr:hypothetical protein [Acidobacteriota bacterium]
QSTLFPGSTFFYIQTVPEFDGWGNNFEYRLGTQLLAGQVIGIRSPGRDDATSGNTYLLGPFIATDYDQDIVWADGFFVHYPAGAQVISGN